MDDRLEELLDRCLLLDLETGWDGAIHKIGAIRCGSNFSRQGRFEQQAALAELDAFAADADFLLGHNLLGHDLPCLRTLSPGLDLLRLPVIDSLYLSPLAFPADLPAAGLISALKILENCLT